MQRKTRILLGLGLLSTFLLAFKKYQAPVAIEAQDAPMLFIHGIKGGELQDAQGKMHWLTAPQALNFESPALRLPLQWKSETEQAHDELKPVNPLHTVTLIPGLIEGKVYTGILREGPKHYKHFYPFAYDWRRSNLENRDHLLERLRELKAKHQKPVSVVAHSMGGMITLAALQKESELFDKVFFVGVPFKGGIGFLEDLHAGIPTVWNNTILSPEVLATMPSVYSLFRRDVDDDLHHDDKNIDVDFFQLEEWERLKMGPFAFDFAQNPEFQAHFRKALKVAKTFRDEMLEGDLVSQGESLKPQPAIYVVASHHLPTMVQVLKDGPDSIRGWDFKNGRREMGDGRVSFQRAFPPEGLEYETFEAHAEHSQMLNDPDILDWIFSR